MQNIGETEGLRIERRGASAVVVYARPAARNAVTVEMRRTLVAGLKRIARDVMIYAVVQKSELPVAFSVGGDLRQLMQLASVDRQELDRAVHDVSAASWHLECFSKPVVSLIEGLVIGTGAGLSLYGTHRVAGARYRFGMPECSIGYFVDCGLAHVFARMPASIGMYLALTGRMIGRADAYRLKLVTHCIDAEAWPEIEAGLAEAEAVDPMLDTRHVDPGEGEVMAMAGRIEAYFNAPSVGEILDRLARAEAPDRDWAEAVTKDIVRSSPLSLCVTHRAVRAVADLDLKEALEQDYRIAHRIIVGHDVAEGVRARLVDKTNDPKWQPARVADVTEAEIAACFAPVPGEAPLPSRTEMQAARV